MPRVKGRVLKVGVIDGEYRCLVSLNRKIPSKGELCTLEWGKKRTNDQNSLYWKFLTWLMEDCGLKEQYDTEDELHEQFKGRFLVKMVESELGLLTVIRSTKDLDTAEFHEYIEKINNILPKYLNIDPSPFWEEYEFYKK